MSRASDTGDGGVGGLLGAYRRAAGLTQARLAALAGISMGSLRDLEQGRTCRPQPGSLARLARALGLDEAQAQQLLRAAQPQAPPRMRPPGRDGGSVAQPRGGTRSPVRALAAAPAEAVGGVGAGRGLWVQVLGPLAVWRGGVPVELGGRKQRAVLGLLALEANGMVHREAIIDALWHADPPATAVNVVQGCVSRLRRVFGQGGSPDAVDRDVDLGVAAGPPAGADGGGRLVGVGGGYRLQLHHQTLDMLVFERLAGQARAAGQAGQAASEDAAMAACALYERALSLWQGEPLADVDLLRGHPAVIGLARRRVAVLVEYAELAVEVGLSGRVVAQLEQLTSREPLNERAHALLMLSLAGIGQQAAALAVFEALRGRLDEQLGVSPGRELSQAHLRVLRQQVPAPSSSHPARQVQAAPPPAPTPAPVPMTIVPRQLPVSVRHFAGRAGELQTLHGLLGQIEAAAAQAGGAVVISAIGGTAGIGKTALAVNWAHQVANRFGDGQLYVDLRGFDPSGTPMAPAEALRGFLDALGVPSERIPASLDAQAGLYRSLLAGKRMLLVLDNACDERQVRPLLPASSTCLVLVTSRDQLTGLAATEGASSLVLDLLTTDDGCELLARRLGADRVAAEPRAVAELIGLCARLPLALSITAARAATHPSLPLAALAAELRDARGLARLDVLDTGEAATSVRAVLSWSCRHLSAPAARLFRLLGLHPGPDFTAAAAASLAAIPLDHARRLLRELARVHLLAEPEHTPGRYAFHDLLRAYAAEKARACDTADERHAALTRLFDHYLHAAAAADTLLPAERHRRSHVPMPPSPVAVPPLDTPAAARGWLDAERASLVAVTGHTARHGWPGHTIRLAAALFRYLERGGYYADALTVHAHALHAARQIGDHGAQAHALVNLAGVDWRQGRYQQAAGRLQQALALCREVGDRDGEAMALANLGLVEWRQGRYQQAAGRFQQALALCREVGDRDGEARILSNLGPVDERQGYDREAAHYLRQALTLYREFGDRDGQADALANLGLGEWRQGRYREAVDHLRRMLARFREFGDRDGEASALANLGLVEWRQGSFQEAADHLQRALAIFGELGDRDGEARVLDYLGLVDQCLGRHRQAIDCHRQALAIFCELGDLAGQAEARNGLGGALCAAGRHVEACGQHRDALALAGWIGDRYQQARAHDGLARACQAASKADQARRHRRRALKLYTELGVPEAEQLRQAGTAVTMP